MFEASFFGLGYSIIAKFPLFEVVSSITILLAGSTKRAVRSSSSTKFSSS